MYLCAKYVYMKKFCTDTPAVGLMRCADDIMTAVQEDRFTIDMQVRAYDLLDTLLTAGESVPEEDFSDAAARFCAMYQKYSDVLDSLYDETELKNKAESLTEHLRDRMNEARSKAASAVSLHESAKEVFHIWQTKGIFARCRALRELRERAGFRLESSRIGNYVAKTFDLMNEAQADFAKAQQAVFASDVSYKIRQGVYDDIFAFLDSANMSGKATLPV